jgi:alpha-amylase
MSLHFILSLVALILSINFNLNNFENLHEKELPNCEIFNDESCLSDDQINANSGIEKRRWQTPRQGQQDYQPSYQDYHTLVGYADIKYTNYTRNQADVCMILNHKHQNSKNIKFRYFFNEQESSSNCKLFNNLKDFSIIKLRAEASDGTKLTIPEVDLYWNNQNLANRPGDFREGKKGAIVELFGWPYKDVEKECELLSKAGYLGIKLYPVHEHIMSTKPESGSVNPW